jgi:DNA polymerase-3 subunit beta
MQFSVDPKALSNTLGAMISVVERASINPILGNVKIVAQNSTLHLSTTNLESYITRFLFTQVKQEGGMTVSAKMLLEILRKIGDSEINISYNHEASSVKIVGQSCQFILPTLPVSDYPTFAEFQPLWKCEVKPEDLAAILEKTSFAMSNEEARYNLNGVCLDYKDSSLKAIATDCHRLAMAKKEINLTEENNPIRIIVPKRSVEEIMKFTKTSPQGNITLSVGTNAVMIQDSSGILMSKLIDGSFPDYDELIPNENPNQLICNANHLGNIISRVSIVTSNISEKLRIIQLIINNKFLEIKSASTISYNCFANEKINLQDFGYTYEGKEINIGFNPKYILDICKVMYGEDIKISFKDSLSSIQIQAVENANSQFVVMPLKVPTSISQEN